MTRAEIELSRYWAVETGDQSWRESAACRGLPTSWFFPERGEPLVEALTVCSTCSVKKECLDYALRHGIHHGVWGGTSEKRRRALRRRAA